MSAGPGVDGLSCRRRRFIATLPAGAVGEPTNSSSADEPSETGASSELLKSIHQCNASVDCLTWPGCSCARTVPPLESCTTISRDSG